jgi:hypothetical protein
LNNRMKKRIAYIPSVTEARLEERVVMSSASAAPLAAPPPVSSTVLVQDFGHPLTVRQLRADYSVQVRVATAELRDMIKVDIQQLYSNGSVRTAQQMTDFTAMVDGTLDATALRVSSQAALLPDSATTLVPAIQNELLGSGSASLASRLSSLVQSPGSNQSARTLEAMATRKINSVSQQIVAQFSNYFNSTPVASLAVTSSGQPTTLKQYFGGQIESQAANTLGSLAQSFPSVANAALFPNGTTSGTVDQSLLTAFTSQSNVALATAAFQIGSTLALFPGFLNVTSQLQPVLFNSTTNNNSAVNATSLTATLGSLEFGSTGFNSAVASAFNTTFQSVVGAISPFFGVQQTQSTQSLPTTGSTNPFGSQFTTSSFNSGFNNGFVTGTGTGFIAFGQAPTSFNTDFGTGFDAVVSDTNIGAGFTTTPLGLIGTVGGVPIQNR